MAVRKTARRKKTSSADKPYVQFSKKLITAVMIFWGLIRACSVIAVWLNPEAGTTMAAIVRGVDDIAMINVLAYTGNSVSEKIALGYFKMRSGDTADEEKEDSNG